jgi:hypothetical protein
MLISLKLKYFGYRFCESIFNYLKVFKEKIMIYKKFIIAFAVINAFNLSAMAQLSCGVKCSGIYGGGQLGWGKTDFDINEAFNRVGVDSPSQEGMAGRFYIGYQYNRYIGSEMGFALFSDVQLPYDIGTYSAKQLDFLLKVGTPFADSGFRADLKLGAAQILSNFDAGNAAQEQGIGDATASSTKAIVGASVSYNFVANTSIDVSYLHAFGEPHGKDTNYAPNIDLLTLGVSFLIPTI